MGRAGKLEGLRNFIHMWGYIFTVYVCLGLYSSTVFLATRRNLQHRKYHQCPINHPWIICNHSHTIVNINWFPWRETCEKLYPCMFVFRSRCLVFCSPRKGTYHNPNRFVLLLGKLILLFLMNSHIWNWFATRKLRKKWIKRKRKNVKRM